MQRHEEVEWLFASDFDTCVNLSLPSHLADIVSRGGTVVSVCNIGVGNLCEFLLQLGRLLERTAPQNMAHTIVTGNVCIARSRGHLFDQLLNRLLVFSESQKNGADISVLNVCQFGSVFLLLSKSKLVLFDPVVFVVLYTRQSHNSFLAV